METLLTGSTSISEEKGGSRETSPHPTLESGNSAAASGNPAADDTEYPSNGRLALIILALSLAFFLVTLVSGLMSSEFAHYLGYGHYHQCQYFGSALGQSAHSYRPAQELPTNSIL